MSRTIKPSDKFKDAAEDWLAAHSAYISKRTVGDYAGYLKPLLKIFGNVPLNKITLSAMRDYQTLRRNGDPRTGASRNIANERINAELGTVRQVLKEAGLWKKFAEIYKQLPIDRDGSGTSLTLDEEKIFMEIIFSHPKWITKAHIIRIMLKTGCGFGELRHMRRGDVDLDTAQITINKEGAKNKYRQRTVPLIPEALESIQWLEERWKRLGGKTAEQYLIPSRKGRTGRMSFMGQPREYDLNKPAGYSSLGRHWTDIRKIAVERIGPKMKKFRIYDCRVTAITRTLSDGRTPIYAAQRVFGHVSREMENRYFKPDGDVLRKTLSALDTSIQPVAAPEPRRLPESQNGSGISVASLIDNLRSAGMPDGQILNIVHASHTPAGIRQAAFNICEKVDIALAKIPGKVAAALALPKKKAESEG